MKDPKKRAKLENVKKVLEKQGILFLEMKNGQLQVDHVNFWATTEKWYDPKTETKGIGLNSFVQYLRSKGI